MEVTIILICTDLNNRLRKSQWLLVVEKMEREIMVVKQAKGRFLLKYKKNIILRSSKANIQLKAKIIFLIIRLHKIQVMELFFIVTQCQVKIWLMVCKINMKKLKKEDQLVKRVRDKTITNKNNRKKQRLLKSRLERKVRIKMMIKP